MDCPNKSGNDTEFVEMFQPDHKLL